MSLFWLTHKKKQLFILENIFKLSKVSRLLSLERLKGEEGWLLPRQEAVVRPPIEISCLRPWDPILLWNSMKTNLGRKVQ